MYSRQEWFKISKENNLYIYIYISTLKGSRLLSKKESRPRTGKWLSVSFELCVVLITFQEKNEYMCIFQLFINFNEMRKSGFEFCVMTHIFIVYINVAAKSKKKNVLLHVYFSRTSTHYFNKNNGYYSIIQFRFFFFFAILYIYFYDWHFFLENYIKWRKYGYAIIYYIYTYCLA